MKIDGHIHTPFCPHGSNDAFEKYIEKAIASDFTTISFTEHAPLPVEFDDPTPDKDSGMAYDKLQEYFKTIAVLKEKYRHHITINAGLEVDYIVGYEQQTTDFLNTFGPQLDDAILSVHFLPLNGQYTCIDFSDEVYMQFAKQIGSVKEMYDLYYNIVEKSILADLGPYKPKRIGHPTLIHKFQLAHGETIDDDTQIKRILQLMKQHGYALDVNSAGLEKPLCQQPYPPLPYINYAQSIALPYVFGSDAHTVSGLHKHYDLLFPQQKGN